MPKTIKKPTSAAGPQAAFAKLADCREMVARIQQEIETLHAQRTNDAERPDLGWRHFGEAAHLRERLKEIGDLLGIERNEVLPEEACPGCGTRDADRLVANERDITCSICGCEYRLD